MKATNADRLTSSESDVRVTPPPDGVAVPTEASKEEARKTEATRR